MTTLTDLSQLTKSMVKKFVEEPKPAPMPKAEVPTCRPHVCRCGTLAQGCAGHYAKWVAAYAGPEFVAAADRVEAVME